MQFNQFKQVFQSNFNQLIEGQVQLYVTDVDKHELWNAYLAAFLMMNVKGLIVTAVDSSFVTTVM